MHRTSEVQPLPHPRVAYRMRWLPFPLLLFAFLLQAVEVPTLGASEAPSKPNMIVVLIDDMGYSDLGCFDEEGGPTPRIDQLAAQGIRFRQFYVNAPICSPSRAALTTGQYPHRLRITSYLADRAMNEQRGVAQWMAPETPTLARSLKAAGYATGHFGKWHLGGQRDVGEAPLITEYGFDESLTNFEGLGPRVLPMLDAFDGKPAKPYHLGSANLGHGEIRWHDRSTLTSQFVDAAIDFIKRARKQDQPFYVNLWPDDVHSPFFPPESLRKKTNGKKPELYRAVLQAMDEQLGVLFDFVRNDDALRNNTLIVLLSDNGNEEGAGTCRPFRGGKTWLYEGGVRSPLIVWGPGHLAETSTGTVNRGSVFCALDLNRSLHAIAGVEPAESSPHDGENLKDVLLGRSTDSRQKPIFWRRPPDRPGNRQQDNPDLAVREGPWKFLANYDDSNPELYNLEADPTESQNLVDQKPEIAARLHAALEAWNATLPPDAGSR